MQSETGKIRLFVLALMNLSLMAFGSNAVAQQSIEDNVRPAGQVCLAGQSCVGSTVGTASTVAPAASTRVAAPVAAVVEEIAEEVSETDNLSNKLVEDFGQFDPTLELSKFEFPPLELLKKY
ncbi:MAG: hypothetical protein JKY29_02840, partial [Gammaproteobacteria bacterium]|nr:hypothetical protein [Gammaproteobacteria bacterium]